MLPGLVHPLLAPVAAAVTSLTVVALARRGPTLLGPFLAGCSLALIASVVAVRPALEVAIRRPDLPLPRVQHPVQRVRLLDAPEPGRLGYRATAQWLGSCQPGSAGACRTRHGRLALTLPPDASAWGVGTQLRILGFVHPPPGYRNPGADTALARWRRAGLRGRIRALRADQVAVEGAATALSLMAQRRVDLRRGMLRLVPGRAGGLLRALALGDRSGVDPAHLRVLRRTGTAHVLAVSGTHVGFVLAMALGLLRLALRFSRVSGVLRRWPLPMWELGVGAAVVAVYAGLTGAAPSTLRAVVVAIAALAVRAAGTRPAPVELLGVAAMVALWLDPGASGDAGLALSLLGALGALTGARLPIRGGVVQRVFVVSAAAWASTSLVSVPLFGQLPLLAPLVNLLVVPYVGLVLLPLALVTLVSAGVSDVALGVLLRPLARAATLPIDAMAEVAGWPCLDVGGPDGWILGCSLAGALLLIHALPRRGVASAVALIGLGAVAIVVRPVLERPPHGTVVAHFLDVGHGDATLLRFANGTTMLVDAGGEVGDDGRVGLAAVVPVLRAFGIRRVDHMVLSHAHPDHENGLLAVARLIPVGTFWFNGQGNRSQEHRKLIEALHVGGTAWRRRGDVDIAGVRIHTLWPPRAGPVAGLGLNDNSLVLQVETAGARLLLAGDVERRAEARLVAARVLRPCDVLKVPHHGSRTSSTPAFLDAVAPRLAVAGARSWGQLPFPHHDVSARYARRRIPLWRTERGYVTARLGVAGVQLRQGAASAWLPARRRSGSAPAPSAP